MIVSIRGTSGSGKSTIVRELMTTTNKQSIPSFEDGKLVGHYCYELFRVVGPYPDDIRLASGVDILNRVRRRSELFKQIKRWAGEGNVVYEGLLIANEVQRTVELAKQFDTRVIFLTTPLELCLSRINARRSNRFGDSLFGGSVVLPVNPKKTTEKFGELLRVADRLVSAGVHVERLDCDAALQRCRKWLL